MVQSVLSTLIDAFAIGWIIAKISRPKKRAEVRTSDHFNSLTGLDSSILSKCSD